MTFLQSFLVGILLRDQPIRAFPRHVAAGTNPDRLLQRDVEHLTCRVPCPKSVAYSLLNRLRAATARTNLLSHRLPYFHFPLHMGQGSQNSMRRMHRVETG